MADISIQFHAVPEELLQFVEQCVIEFNLHVVAMRFFPFEAIKLAGGHLEESFADASPYKRLAFTLSEPVLPVANELDFAAKNPDALRLDIGSRGKTELKESWLSARTENSEAIAVWKKIAKRLKDLTEKGALAVNPKTGDSGPARWHRFTPAAKALESSGVRMLAITGIVMRLGVAASKGDP
jgi:hypothetical protein